MYAVTQVAKFCNNPGLDHWNAILHIISYLSNTINYGLVYYEDDQSNSPMGYFKSSNEKVLVMYSDADFCRDLDSYKSVSGYIYMLSNGPISWSSKQQSEVALSSMESEYYAASYAAQEGIWVDQMLEELKIKIDKPLLIGEDNTAAIIFSEHPTNHMKTKHIIRRYHYVRDQVEKKNVLLVKVATEDNLADIFTKPLGTERFIFLRDQFMHNILDNE